MRAASALFSIIRAPVISEKATRLTEKSGVLTLKVLPSATKKEIAAAVSEFFSVTVEAVRVLNVKGKVKGRGQRMGRRSDWKKAYITLPPGCAADIAEQVSGGVR